MCIAGRFAIDFENGCVPVCCEVIGIVFANFGVDFENSVETGCRSGAAATID